MANNNVQNVKFLRNGIVFTPSLDPVKTARQVALDAINGQLNNLADGTAILGRYQETNGTVKTLVGFAYISGDTKTLTVFDVDGAGADVDAKILAAIQALDSNATSEDGNNVQVKVTEVDGKITAVNITTDNTVNSGDVANAITEAISDLDVTDTAVTGEYVSQVSQADGKIAVTRVALPTVAAISEAGKPITAVSESLGTVSATAGTINAEFVNIADAGGIITATNVEGALAEIAAEIDAMDLTQVGDGNGKVIIAVSENDGKVSASATSVSDLTLEGFETNTATTGAITSADTIEAALNKLENKAAAITIANADGSINVTTSATGTDINVNIKSGEHVLAKDGSNGIYTNISLSSITPSSTTVKEEYQLTATDGTKLGDTIKIYKDSSIVEIYLGTSGDSVNATTGVITKLDGDKQYLNYVYFKADGTYEMTKINISVFITEQEFASGVTFDSTENKVKGVVDPTSEGYLTVGANGFKISGIDSAIATAIDGLDSTGGTTTVASGKHVAVEVVETNGKITAVNIGEDDIASAQGLADEITARTADTKSINDKLGTGVTSNNTATAQLAALSGNNQSTSADTSVEGAKRYADDKVATIVDGLDSTVTAKTANEHISISIEEKDGKLVQNGLTITESDIASASGLSDEIAARKDVDGQSGQTYAANSGKAYISGATSLNDADIKLNDAIASLDADVIKSVKVNNVALAETSNTVNVQISSVAASGASSSPIVVNTNDETGAVTLQILQIDCGEY